MIPFCTVEGCSKPIRSKFAKYCDMHYSRLKRSGHLGLSEPKYISLALLQAQAAKGLKTCPRCKQIKLFADFDSAQRTRTGRYPYCKLCRREDNFIRKYGITLEQHKHMFDSQGGKCAICHRNQTQMQSLSMRYNRLNIDHCHSTGKIRGLICSDCNIGISRFKDDVNLLTSAIQYLKQH